MVIEQTVKVPDDYRLFLELPRTVPSGVIVRVSITIPTAFDNQRITGNPVKSFRGILKGKGISVERFREIQSEDKALEDAAEKRQKHGIW